MDGTVSLKDDGGYVASQMWNVVSKSISYSSGLMDKLFATVGVTEDDKSPFCHSFSSLNDLMDELINYLPHTFKYNDMQGNGSDQTSDNMNETGNVNTPTQELLVERIKRFANDMARGNDKEDDNGDDSNDEDKSSAPPTASDGAAVAPPAATTNSQELITFFRAILSVVSVDNILEKVLVASSCLEGKENMQGAASLVRKAKSLVQRWLTKAANGKDESKLHEKWETLIQRDVVVLVNVTVGKGASASSVPQYFRVVDIYDKHYNKWFMSKQKNPVKIWKKEEKPYKLKI